MILILGGSGFVGSAFARWCERAGADYRIVTRENYPQYVGIPCDILINANGNSRKPLAASQPLVEFDASVRSVRQSLVDFKAATYVHLSSCDVYPDCSSPDATQESQVPFVDEQSPYGFHKYLAEQCVRHGTRQWLIFRSGGFVGPGLKKNAIFDILHGTSLWLDPSSELQYLSTDAAADLAMELVSRGISREVFNLCGDGTIRLQEIIDLTGSSVQSVPGSPRVHYHVSIGKLQRYMPVPATRDEVRNFLGMPR